MNNCMLQALQIYVMAAFVGKIHWLNFLKLFE
jgi:hypothetical protein